MLKVRFETVTIRVPVIDNSGEHDAKMEEAEYAAIHQALAQIQPSLGAAQGAMIACSPVSPTQQKGFRTTNVMGDPVDDQGMTKTDRLLAQFGAPPSQDDPAINTAVTDREMNSSAPDVSLQEFRERPERTRGAPRPRANSWRHEQ